MGIGFNSVECRSQDQTVATRLGSCEKALYKFSKET